MTSKPNYGLKTLEMSRMLVPGLVKAQVEETPVTVGHPGERWFEHFPSGDERPL